MNILIADDEYLVRATLKSMLEEIGSCNNIMEASNGEELISKAKQMKPDIAFVDIEMPKTNGLNSIKALKFFCPTTEWIILTGYAKFEYAQEALSLGVCQYLLKPVSPNELSNVISKIKIRQQESYIRQNTLFEHDLNALFGDRMMIDDLDKSNIVLSYHYLGTILFYDSSAKEEKLAELQRNVWNSINSISLNYSHYDTRVGYISLSSGRLATVYAWSPDRYKNGLQMALSFISKTREISRSSATNNYHTTIICGSECLSFSELSRQFNTIQALSSLRILFPFNRDITLSILKQTDMTISITTRKLLALLMDIRKNYRYSTYHDFINSIDNLQAFLTVNHLGNDCLIPYKDFLQCCFGIKLYSSSEEPISEFIKRFKQCGQQLLKSSDYTENLIDKVISYINSNYMSDISIYQIADSLNITPNYLSSLFHKETGENFMHYLTKTRLLKAREMLTSNPKLQISQVSRDVGYYTVAYFTKLYKKFFGVCPSKDSYLIKKPSYS